MKVKIFFIFLIAVFAFINVNCTNPFMEQILDQKTVTFDSNGGSHVSSQTLIKGKTVRMPADPQKIGNYFIGWYQDNGTFLNEWDFSIIPNRDITLYAKWVDINEGSNGEDKPFLVYDVKTLKYVGRGNENPEGYKGWTLSANYEQIENIDLTGTNWTPIGSPSNGSQPFTGTFNGNGYTITGLNIVTEQYDSQQGMFGVIDTDGVVKNLALVNCTVGGGANYNIGGVAGINNGTVISCSVSGNIIGGDTVGGVVGYNLGTVQNCYSTAAVNGGGNSIGGVVGNNEETVQNCYSAANVSGGDSDIGGVVGSNSGTVQNCYATGTVSGGGIYIGGVVGNNSDTVQNCYAAGTVEGGDYVGGIVGYTDGAVMNCVALNTNIKTTGAGEHIGRVAYNASIDSYNYGNTDMMLNDKKEEWTYPALDGYDVSSSDYHREGWWKNEGTWIIEGSPFAWDFTGVWEWDSVAMLPKLRNVRGQ